MSTNHNSYVNEFGVYLFYHDASSKWLIAASQDADNTNCLYLHDDTEPSSETPPTCGWVCVNGLSPAPEFANCSAQTSSSSSSSSYSGTGGGGTSSSSSSSSSSATGGGTGGEDSSSSFSSSSSSRSSSSMSSSSFSSSSMSSSSDSSSSMSESSSSSSNSTPTTATISFYQDDEFQSVVPLVVPASGGSGTVYGNRSDGATYYSVSYTPGTITVVQTNHGSARSLTATGDADISVPATKIYTGYMYWNGSVTSNLVSITVVLS